ncbi:nicotianamine synthase [Pyrus ussuriensis x Pyrus communis]|uniref:Nicotianamine synthase n=3 Tax=Pyrus TaxID=3766 RepID=A0A5N5HR02_9ROSA|nr:nicotianamine synthase 1 [Pyrus betulifolia]AMX27892.1 nicotianamine synthase 1 [Pyrus calleryana]KAB2630269.1 nicotianamine synthase [Pyrus ussuriensis x Pyrus communis]
MGCQGDALVQRICELYEKISSLESLKPSQDVDMLFTQLVLTCIPPSPIDVSKLCQGVQEIRSNLIRLCGEAEGLLENHFSTILGSYEHPLDHLDIFPYYSNYLKLSKLEFNILSQHFTHVPRKIAFVGSGPLPLTSIVLASYHLTKTSFDNYDIDASANSKALGLVSSDPDLSKRMVFHTTDIMDVTTALKDYEIVFLAALVGMDKMEKLKIIDHLAKYMAPGATLMLRSAHGARAFLYPVIDPCDDLRGFEVLSVFHPTDEVINSIVIARKYALPVQHSSPIDSQGLNAGAIILPSKCCELEAFNPLHKHGNMIEELAFEEQLS